MDEFFVEEKTSYDKLLDFLVFIAVFVVTIFLLLEVFAKPTNLNWENINKIYFYINIGVLFIFILDLVRLWKESENVSDFFKNNWLDVLATIPFGIISQTVSSFSVLKLAKFSKLATISKLQKASKISKIGKEFKAASHLKREGEEYKRKHRL